MALCTADMLGGADYRPIAREQALSMLLLSICATFRSVYSMKLRGFGRACRYLYLRKKCTKILLWRRSVIRFSFSTVTEPGNKLFYSRHARYPREVRSGRLVSHMDQSVGLRLGVNEEE